MAAYASVLLGFLLIFSGTSNVSRRHSAYTNTDIKIRNDICLKHAFCITTSLVTLMQVVKSSISTPDFYSTPLPQCFPLGPPHGIICARPPCRYVVRHFAYDEAVGQFCEECPICRKRCKRGANSILINKQFCFTASFF